MRAERALRAVAIGSKKLFVCRIGRGRQTRRRHYSCSGRAKLNGIDPEAYLSRFCAHDVIRFNRIARTAAVELRPAESQRWRRMRPSNTPQNDRAHNFASGAQLEMRLGPGVADLESKLLARPPTRSRRQTLYLSLSSGELTLLHLPSRTNSSVPRCRLSVVTFCRPDQKPLSLPALPRA